MDTGFEYVAALLVCIVLLPVGLGGLIALFEIGGIFTFLGLVILVGGVCAYNCSSQPSR